MRFISSKIFRLVCAVLLVFSAIESHATTDPVITTPLKGSENKVNANAESYAKDTKYFTLSQAGKDSVKNNSIVNMVGVGIEELSNYYIRSNFSVKLTLQITAYDKNEVATGTTTKLFTIAYDTATGAKYKSFEDTVFFNAYAVKAKIISIDSGTVNWPVSKVLKVENQITASRDYFFDCNLATTGLNVILDVANSELTALWTPASLSTNPGITEYDLEWAWIDEGALGNYKLGANYLQDAVFTNNATRVSITGSSYNIPLLYDDSGRVFVRVRPVQLRTDGQRVEGKWSWITNDITQPVISATPVYYSYTGHEDKLNWQASTSFAEEGKRKSVVQYFDGSLRSRQTVTKDNSSNTTVVAESFYDYQGRPVIQVLPAPTLNTAIGYARNFNRAVGEDGYPKWVYDKLGAGATVCSSPAKPFNTDFGTANYYSAKNPMLATDAKSKYIPDATAGNPNEAYAFTETRLSPDGRIGSQSGVGVTHQIGSNHETKYFYEAPAQEELDALFGTDAGVASHYFKNIVKDANGQYSVSYADMQGRTVATALAGEAPKNADGTPMLEALDSKNEVTFTKQLIDNETNLVVGNTIVSSKPIVALKDGAYTFDYSLSPKQLSLLNCNNTPVCYDCLYKLKFTISSDCSSTYTYVDSSYNFTLGQYLTQCNSGNANQGFVKHFVVPLLEGSYTVTKTLTLSTEAQNGYRDIFLANDTCKKFLDFYAQSLTALQATSNCVITCESCKASLGGSFAGFRAKFVAESGTPEPLSATIVAQLQAAYDEAYANCDRMCNNNDGMDLVRSIKQSMLQDVTPPYGQYAKIDLAEQAKGYNIFKINDFSNALEGYGGSAALPDYKRPMQFSGDDASLLNTGKYYDALNQAENINYVVLPPTQFADSFKTSWANQLLVHHPEFKKLQLSETQLKTAYQFEANLEKDTTWLQAVSHNYITNLVDNDPFFSGVGAVYKQRMLNGSNNGANPSVTNLDVDPMVHGINNYLPVQNGKNCSPQVNTGITVSMWQLALSTVYCRDKADAADQCIINLSDPNSKIACLIAQAAQPANSFSLGCNTDRDWAWKVFKNLYLAERRKLIAVYLNTNAPVFPVAYPNNGIPPYQLRFVNHANPQSAMDNVGVTDAGSIGDIINNAGNSLNGGLGQANNLALDQYDSTCRGYAATWIAQLQACPQIGTLSTADSTWLVTRLHKICKTGADEYHFLGSASVKPGTNGVQINGTGPVYSEFPDVIKEFLQSKGINAPYNAECFPWMITVPKPYDKQPVLANSYVLTKPSACECERINSVKLEYSNSGFQGTFSAYMLYQHGTVISQEQLDALSSLCASPATYACKMLEKPIALPPALQCRGVGVVAPKTCISCQEYKNYKSDYFATTGQAAPFASPQNQTEVGYNSQFASYMNYRTGFTKTCLEYIAFQNTCDAVNPPISCGSLDSTLNQFYLSPEYLQNPTGLSCMQAFVNYFNAHYNRVFNYQQWMALFAQCGSMPNVCKPKITCASFEALVNDFYTFAGVQVYKSGTCQLQFVNYINQRLGSNYTYSQLEAINNYTCTGGCGLNVCSFSNHFLLTRVYNQFRIDFPQPWNLPNCQQAFTDYFNNYFGLSPVLSWSDISLFYPTIDRVCTPDIYSLCTPPYSCVDLTNLVNNFHLVPGTATTPLIPCETQFTTYFNTAMGTNYSYAQIAALYLSICGTQLSVCDVVTDCTQMITLWDTYLTSLCPVPTDGLKHPCDYDCNTVNSGFVATFNAQFGTSYNSFSQLLTLYQKCNYTLVSPCGGAVSTDPVITASSLSNFLTSFNSTYPDAATQLGANCQGVFTAMFNSSFSTVLSYDQIAAYYLAQLQLTLNVCNSQCSKINTLIGNFNTQYASLKLPQAAREDLFTFIYNQSFLPAAITADKAATRFVDDGAGVKTMQATDDAIDAKAFTPTVTIADIQNAIAGCNITGFSLAPSATISIYDAQVLLSLKQVYLIIHPNGLPADCQTDFTGWFNRVMQQQYEFEEIIHLYNNVCGNNAGYICDAAPDEMDLAAVPSVYVELITGITGPNNQSLPPMLCGLNQPAGGPVVYDDNPCKDLPKIAFHVAFDKYQLYVDSLRNVFDTAYHNKCMAAKDLESFTVTYNTMQYHYTLYYYDQSGNLVKTVPPAGVQRLTGLDLQTVKTYRANVLNGQPEASNQKVPNHTLVTQYRYNTLNQVVAQSTPDAGISKFWYDRLGRLVVSQNAKQALAGNYSYTLYDDLGRIKEVGQLANGTIINQLISRNNGDANTTGSLANWLNNKPAVQITRTFYDKSYLDGNGTLCPQYLCQQNLRNRVSYTGVYATGTPGSSGNHTAATFYSYDIHGNVFELLQDYGSTSAVVNGMNTKTDGTASGNRFKKIAYEYDLISGKVNSVAYQPGQPDAFYHRYSYDAENRITDVETSNDKIVWEKDARYSYYKYGPLARTVLGQLQVQGIDYGYSLQGWLKGVNSTTVGDGSFDIGGDGKPGTPNVNIARDAYGFSLNYFNGDYKPVSNAVTPFAGNTFGLVNADGNTVANQLFNGNIAAMAVNIPKLGAANVYGYKYDQLNRIKSMDAFTGLNTTSNTFTAVSTQAYKERVTYDANGNIKTYLRNGNAARLSMDNMAYSYKAGTNQLDKVTDVAPDAALSEYDKYNDIKQGQNNANYTYDAIGNLISDVSEGITNITWNVYGKIQSITKSTGTIYYTYDASGNRISKVLNGKETWYVRDASGNTMSVYTKESAINSNHLTQSETYLYGSSRLGVLNSSLDMQTSVANVGGSSYFYRGNKFFELSNHLQNVLVTISDKRIAHTANSTTIDYYNADVITANDNYVFGMAMPGRKFAQGTSTYRYGFNGKENDNDVKGEGNQIDYGARVYDPRLGKLLSVDPLIDKYPELSSYQYANNSPIANIDLDGLQDYYYNLEWDENGQNPKLTLIRTESSILMKSVYINLEYMGDKFTEAGAQAMAQHYGTFTKEQFDRAVGAQKKDMAEFEAKVEETGQYYSDALLYGLAGAKYANAKKGTSPTASVEKQQGAANNKTTVEGTKNSTNNSGTQSKGGKNNQTNPQKAAAVTGTPAAGENAKPVVKNRNSNDAVGDNILYDVHADGAKKGQLLKVGKGKGDDVTADGRPKRMVVSQRKARAAGYPNATATIRKRLGTTTTKQATDAEATEVKGERANGNTLPLNKEKGKKYKG